MFAFLAKVKVFVENILGQFPQTSTALLTLAATLLAKLGFNVTSAQLAEIVSAAVLLFSLITNDQKVKYNARKAAEAAAPKSV